MNNPKDDNQIADALNNIAGALQRLGNGNASTEFGGLEALGMAIKESAEGITDALNRIADALEQKDK